MKNHLFISAGLLWSLFSMSVHAAGSRGDLLRLGSPDKNIEVCVEEDGGRLLYSVKRGKVDVLQKSPLGITVDGHDLGKGASLVAEPEIEKIQEKYPIFGNHAEASGRGVEAVLPMQASGVRFGLVVRVYNDGVAIRYILPEGAKHIGNERTAWALPQRVKKVAWAEYEPGYEGYVHVTALEAMPDKGYVGGPLTVDLGNCYVTLTEADCESFPDMAFTRSGNTFQAGFPASEKGWDIRRLPDESEKILAGRYKGKDVSPWRCVIIAGDLTALVNSDMLTNLCPSPEEGRDCSWVQPGRCLWQWWSVGAPRYEEQKEWFDAAAKLTWEYYLIDDGWRNWRKDGKGQWELLEEVIAYGRSVGVKSIVWVNSNEMRTAGPRRAYLEKIKAVGASGIKIDFIPAATAEIMQWYMGAMQDCAELGLLLNFHGSVKPTGLSRTYPNDVTREAVRGNEWHILRYGRVLPQSHYVALPFTRLMAGAADVTPVTLNPCEIETGGYTWTHEFAQSIVFLSPITHFSDHYSYYLESPFLDLLKAVPTVWDETRVLSCTEMGEVVAYARRKGNDWWVGVMNGDKEREIEIPLDFLKKSMDAVLLHDDDKILASVAREDRKVSKKETLKVHLRAGGGFVGWFH